LGLKFSHLIEIQRVDSLKMQTIEKYTVMSLSLLPKSEIFKFQNIK